MTFTFITFLILIFLMPGIVFRRAYFLFPFFRKYGKHSLSSDIIGIILTSIVIHLLVLYTISYFTNYIELIKENIFLSLNDYFIKDDLHLDSLSSFKFSPIIYYNIIVWSVAAYLGFLINRFVRFFKLDAKTRLFRFGNEWYYYLKGKILDFKDFEGSSEEINLVYIDVLVDTADGTYIYMGICSDYTLAENGGLSNICITGAKRRKMCNDNVGREGHFKIPSSIVVIPGDQIKNLNLRYFKRKKLSSIHKPKLSFITRLSNIWDYLLIVGIIVFFDKLIKQNKNR